GLLDVARQQGRALPPAVAAIAQPAPPAAQPAVAAPPSESILVVDDSVIVREVERGSLEGAGYNVFTAGDGVEALSILAERPCDLVMTDIDMPRMDGLQLTAQIRAAPRLTQAPVN